MCYYVFFSSASSVLSSLTVKDGHQKSQVYILSAYQLVRKEIPFSRIAAKQLAVPLIGIAWVMYLLLDQSPWIERNFSECPNMDYMKPGVELDPLLNCVS